MPTETVNIELPEEMYERLKGMATVCQRPLTEVIYQSIRGNLPPALNDVFPEQRDLVAELQSQPDEALWVVARTPVPAQRWRRHQQLLHKAETGLLTKPEREDLTELREATDRFVTRRSYALALLKWRGYTIPVNL